MRETKITSPSPVASSQTGGKSANGSPSNAFVAAALGMSWQLAIVVLVPIVGGFELDKAFSISPLLVIIGFIVAMIGFTLVVRRQMQLFTPPVTSVSASEQNPKTVTPDKGTPK